MSLLDSLTRPRTLVILLCLSLALNLFLAGTLAGRFSARGHGRMGHAPPLLGLGVPGFDSGFAFIPQEGREHIRKNLRAHVPELRDEHKALRRLHRELTRELAREAPDRALLQQKFGEIRNQSLHIEEAMQAAFLDAALAMGPIERKRMLDAMQAHHGRPPPRGMGHHGGPSPSDPDASGLNFEAPQPPPGEPRGMPAPDQ